MQPRTRQGIGSVRVTVFNDTEENWLIHDGSAQAVSGSRRILQHSSADFDGPDRSDPFIKIWNGVVMVYFGGRPAVEGIHFVKPPYVDPETGFPRV